MGATTFIELYEDIVCAEVANTYLSKLAREYGIDSDEKLLIPNDEKQLFTSDELKEKFNVWYDRKLRNDLFPQYKIFQNGNQEILARKPDGSAYQELENIIGLTGIKKEIDKIIHYFKAQKLFGERNIKFNQLAMHILFTGNPGTAKTTVARLFAQILKENEILSEGKLYRVGRSNLVGKYVGQTAPLVKEAFKRAKGSVLFIDEAYSLVEKDGLYGDDAMDKLRKIFERARQNMDFGNGRFAKNIVEAAQMTQTDRILCSATASIENCEISLILAEDINIPAEIERKSYKNRIYRIIRRFIYEHLSFYRF